jgi:hypothetical protein
VCLFRQISYPFTANKLGCSPFVGILWGLLSQIDSTASRFRPSVELEGDRLLAGGPDGRAVYEAAREAGVHAPLVTRVEGRDELPFAGW